MKQILFLTPQLPFPPHQGTALRNYGLISGLAARKHRIWLLSFVESDQPLPSTTPLADLCEHVETVAVPLRSRGDRLRDLMRGYPDMARRLWSPAFQGILGDALAHTRFDVIHIEGIEMAPYLSLIKAKAADAMIIYDAHNAEYALQKRVARTDWLMLSRWPAALYSAIQWRRLRRFEAEVCRAVNHVVAVSEPDAGHLRALPHETPITIIPNAISAKLYQPRLVTPEVLLHPALVFTGKMDFRPNVDAMLWFVRRVFPIIRAEEPRAHLIIVGKNPHRRLEALYGHPGITMTGFVPDVRPYIAAADVYIAPLRMGSGTRLKLLEAMALERPIVSTTLGVEGLHAENGVHLLLADEPQTFAEAVLELLKRPARGAELGKAAAALVRERHIWAAVIPLLEEAYRRAE
jgi:sugar transferase (PEP-CTERM/EpsH1 system associated)